MEKSLIHDFKKSYGREPIIRKTKNGTLLCVCLSGGNWEPENANVVKIQKSYDDGKTWSDPILLNGMVKAEDFHTIVEEYGAQKCL